MIDQLSSVSFAKAVAYFQTIIQLFQTLPTYTWLANAGITPSRDQTYTLSEILSALKQGSGGVSSRVPSSFSLSNLKCSRFIFIIVHTCRRLLARQAGRDQLVLQLEGIASRRGVCSHR
jgi:hypothetical protein